MKTFSKYIRIRPLAGMLHEGAGQMLMFCAVCFLREHHLSDHRRRAAGTAAASQESEEEGESTSRLV